MAIQSTIKRRLAAVVIPTPFQALICLVIAVVVLVGSNIQRILLALGIDDMALNATRAALHGQFGSVLASPISASVALVTFWATVGLIAYLISWSGFNLLIQARNEVTLNTQYTNRGHVRGSFETLGLKSVGAIVLLAFLALLKPGLAVWISIAGAVISAPTLINILFALVAALGFATQLYLVLAAVLVTFTPWYREEAYAGE